MTTDENALPVDFPRRLPTAVQQIYCRGCRHNVQVHSLDLKPWPCRLCPCERFGHVLLDEYLREWLDRRARGVRPSIPTAVREAVLKRDGMVCRYCRRRVHTRKRGPGRLHIDHVIPWSHGGPHTVENLVVSCAHCNLAKHDDPTIRPTDWSPAAILRTPVEELEATR